MGSNTFFGKSVLDVPAIDLIYLYNFCLQRIFKYPIKLTCTTSDFELLLAKGNNLKSNTCVIFNWQIAFIFGCDGWLSLKKFNKKNKWEKNIGELK